MSSGDFKKEIMQEPKKDSFDLSATMTK